jgi:hypothetical protein
MHDSTAPHPRRVIGRPFLGGAILALAAPVVLGAPAAAPPTPAGPTAGIRRELFIRSPKPGTAVVLSASYYTKPEGVDLISMHGLLSRSDTVDAAFFRRSQDNGRTWSDPVEVPSSEHRPDGTFRRVTLGGSVDPQTGRACATRTSVTPFPRTAA